MTTPVKIREESDKLHAIYQRGFGGLPRITRDPRLLQDILEQTRRLVTKAPAGVNELRQTLQSRVTLYSNELAKIQEDQARGPYAQAAARVASDANAAFHRYRRHFAGKSRWNRDTDLLRELIEELQLAGQSFETIAQHWDDPTLTTDRETVANSKELYVNEIEEIERSRQELNEDQVVSMTAEWANELFSVYRRQFAGLPRLSRRPALLERLVTQLRQVEAAMSEAIASGNKNESLIGNVELVRQQVQAWETEQNSIVDTRASTDINNLVDSLVQEHEAVWEMWSQEFAGQQRRTRDIDMLSGLLDRADEVARQARELHRSYELDTTKVLVGLARDQRIVLQREFDLVEQAIREAQGEAGNKA